MNKKKAILILLGIFCGSLFAQLNSKISIDALYIELFDEGLSISIGEPDYIGEVSGLMDTYGPVKALYKKASNNEIKTGKYKITLKKLFDDYYKIDNSSYIVKIRYGYINEYSQYVLESSGYSLTIYKYEY